MPDVKIVKVQVIRTDSGEWFVRAKGGNGEVIAHTETYKPGRGDPRKPPANALAAAKALAPDIKPEILPGRAEEA